MDGEKWREVGRVDPEDAGEKVDEAGEERGEGFGGGGRGWAWIGRARRMVHGCIPIAREFSAQ